MSREFIGVVGRMPGAKAGLVVDTTGKREFHLHQDDAAGLHVGLEVRFKGRDSVDFRDVPSAREIVTTGYAYSIRKDHGRWEITARDRVEMDESDEGEEAMDATAQQGTEQLVGVIVDVRASYAVLIDKSGTRHLVTGGSAPKGERLAPLYLGSEVRFTPDPPASNPREPVIAREVTPTGFGWHVGQGTRRIAGRRPVGGSRPFRDEYPPLEGEGADKGSWFK